MAKTTRINTKEELLALPNNSKVLFVIKKTMQFHIGTINRSDVEDIFMGIDLSGMLDLNPEDAYIFASDIKFNRGKISIEDIKYNVYLFELEPD